MLSYKIGCLSLLATLISCSSVTKEYSHVKNKPTISKSSLDEVKQCVKDTLDEGVTKTVNHGLGFFVRDVADGTVPKNSSVDGELSDAGRIQLLASISKLHPKKHQIITMYNFPKIFNNDINGLLTDVGTPDTEQFISLIDTIKETINGYRKKSGLLEIEKTGVYVIDAAFTRFDGKDGRATGWGVDSEYSKKTQLDLSMGTLKEKKIMTLTVNIINPSNNIIEMAESFDLLYEKTSNEKGFKIVRNNSGIGMNIETVNIESVHSAQSTLIDYAAIWILSQFSDKNLDKCYHKENQ